MHRIIMIDNTPWQQAQATMLHDWKPSPTRRVKVNFGGAYDQGNWNGCLELVIRESLSTDFVARVHRIQITTEFTDAK